MRAKFLIPFLVLLVACNTGNVPLTDDMKEAVKAEGAAVVSEVMAAMTNNKFDVMFGLMENSSDFSMAVAGEIYTYEALKKLADQAIEIAERQTFETKSEKYVIVDESCFIYLWMGKNEVFMKTGESFAYDEYVITYGFRKVEGSWKIFFGHESYKVPLPFDLEVEDDEKME